VIEEFGINYGAVVIAAVIAGALPSGLLLLSRLLAPRQASSLKAIAYECGIIPGGRYWTQLYVRYCLYALLFLVFAVEVVFLFPWAVVFLKLGGGAFVSMLLFIVILLFGLLYARVKGVLRWG
jgi:NADH-quinone oxidoreductase subunit A